MFSKHARVVAVVFIAGCTARGNIGSEPKDSFQDDPGHLQKADAPPIQQRDCPSAAPLSDNRCGTEGQRCDYGSETCCGQTYPSMVCTCEGGGFRCSYTDACLIPPGYCNDGGTDASNCPPKEPLDDNSCGSEGLRCEYGSETCCGQTYPSMVCTCRSGVFSCSYTDACLIPPGYCDDGGVPKAL
jgi:hypothetical protein